ncbi:hypothetical protein ONS96_008697 [Cadophora gregata f. sp. sojae]|nr:hypothetical protein ONS96_008697 [Cadophora gregata f. sp. sojae]
MFTIFSNLPSELRVKIWQQACFPRTLTLTYNSTISSFTSTTPPPTLLSVSRESRHEALRIYTLSFGTTSQPPQTYFNPLFDTLYLPRHQEMGYDETLRDFRQLVHDPSCLLNQVRYVAIDHVNVDVKRPWESYNKAVFLRSFKHLDEIALILNADGTGAGDISPPLLSPSQTTEIKKQSQVKLIFEELRIDPERLLKIWYYFRQSFMIEERLLEDICRDSGREYQAFELPTVRILAKGFEDVGAVTRSTSNEFKAGKHMQAALDMMRS